MSLPASPAPSPALTEDRLLGGRLKLRQPQAGYRAGMDAALLAAACDAGPGARVLEAGCGAGAALLAAAARRLQSRFLGLEQEPEAVRLAQANIGRLRARLSPATLGRARVSLALVTAVVLVWRLRGDLGFAGPSLENFLCH